VNWLNLIEQGPVNCTTFCSAYILHSREFYHTQITIDTLRCLTFIIQLISYPGFVNRGGLDVCIVQLRSCPVFLTLEKAYQQSYFFCSGQDVCPRRQMSDECLALHDRCCTLQRVQEIWTARLIGLGGLSNILSDHLQLSSGLPHAKECVMFIYYFSHCLPQCCYIPCDHNSCPSLGLRSVLCVNVNGIMKFSYTLPV
jgi:hypothetical protein